MNTLAATLDRAAASDAETFMRQGYVAVPRLIEPALADYFWSYVHTKFASLLLGSGDPQVPHSPADYGDAAFNGLLEFLRPRIERATGLTLYPTYSISGSTNAATCSSATATGRLARSASL